MKHSLEEDTDVNQIVCVSLPTFAPPLNSEVGFILHPI